MLNNNMKPFFSIVIPLYNKEESIINTVNSVLDQKFQSYELIIVDDGSTDSSLEKVSVLKDVRIKVYSQKNAGVSAARNKGFEIASCEHVCLLDADDYWFPNFLSEVYSLINDFPDSGLYCTNYNYILADGEVKKTSFKCVPERGVVQDYYKAVSRNKGSGLTSQSSICVKKSAWLQVGGYPQGVTHTEDSYFCSIISHFYTVTYTNKVLAEYRLGAENRTSNTKPMRERFIVKELSKYLDENSDKYKYLSSFIGKHILHTAANCLDNKNKNMFYSHLSDSRLSFLSLSPYYKSVYLLFRLVPFKFLEKL